MATGFKIDDREGLYFITLQIVGWVDVFTRKIYRDIVIESLKYCQQHKGLDLFAYVIMSNHIHMLVQSQIGDLSGTIRDFKNYSSREIMEIIYNDNIESRKDWMRMVFEYHGKFKKKQERQLWTHENHAELLDSERFISQKLDYIHNNPVKSGIVQNPEDFLYSSAKNYAGMDGVIDVILLDVAWKTY